MYLIKKIPEDFVVKELIDMPRNDSGKYCYHLLQKKNVTTQEALDRIASFLHIPLKSIGFAGNKDKIACTEQVISLQQKRIEELKLSGIKMTFMYNGDEPATLGSNT